MLNRLLRAIARLLTHTTQPSVGMPVPPTQPAGPVLQEPTQARGNKRSVAATKPRKSKSVTAKSSSKPKAAQSTKAASSRKAKPKAVRATSGATGSQPATPARRTRHHNKASNHCILLGPIHPLLYKALYLV